MTHISEADRCPECDTAWAYLNDGERYSRIIGIYSRETDRTVAWQCPACSHRWPRDAEVPG